MNHDIFPVTTSASGFQGFCGSMAMVGGVVNRGAPGGTGFAATGGYSGIGLGELIVTGGKDVCWVHPEISIAGSIATQHIMMPFISLPSLTANQQINSFEKVKKRPLFREPQFLSRDCNSELILCQCGESWRFKWCRCQYGKAPRILTKTACQTRNKSKIQHVFFTHTTRTSYITQQARFRMKTGEL